MLVLSNGNGSFLVEEGGEELQWYDDQGYDWDETGRSVKSCGDDELFEDVEIDGDIDGECSVVISYLVQIGMGRHERVNYRGQFSGRELIGKWEEI